MLGPLSSSVQCFRVPPIDFKERLCALCFDKFNDLLSKMLEPTSQNSWADPHLHDYRK